MSFTNTATQCHVASRFGLGGRPDQPVSTSVMEWLTQQLAPRSTVSGPTLDACLAQYVTFGKAPAGSTAKSIAMANIGALFHAEQQSYMFQAVTTTTPFLERLVRFWTNHFAIQAANVATVALSGSFVRDVIRANIGGNFTTMLQAAIQHPALVHSLNNEHSAGPNSVAAMKYGMGFNENLGRETLELFTVGTAAGYKQADVDALAYLLAGVTVNLVVRPYGGTYNPMYAQPGNSTLLGITYPNTHVGCVAALNMLGNHSSTYRNLALKLATHFISDTPSSADIATIQGALASSGGNLTAAAMAVLSCQGAWQPLTKLRTPQDYVIALMRAGSVSTEAVPSLSTRAAQLGEPVWQPPFPNGWSDFAADWCGPAQLDSRFRYAAAFAASPVAQSPAVIVAATVGALLSSTTQAAIANASSAVAQLTLLFASPEFQRR